MSKKAEENKDTNIEQEAWDFVDLVFTGKYKTDTQDANLVELAENLKGNEIALKYIDLDIQNLIYSTVIGNDKGFKEILKNCYDELDKPDSKPVNKNNLPLYLGKLKDLTDPESQDLYNNVVASYKRYYGVITKQGDLVNIKERLDDLDRRVKNNSIDAKNNIKNNIIEAENNIKKELYPEFIAILGIFTAITFAIFGGMNLLSNLFQNMRSTHASLGQALILASVFGFTLWGLIEILFIWISKINLTKDDKIDKDDKKEKKIDKKEKIFNWSALSFLTVILIFGLALFFS
ncbi:hypothetical protein JF73_06790 [Lactobacillus helsingborgensis]|uniref:Uncharacterized protein n=1 Tax=Lactobacillus helsingborgensis TaxID=1218494 RepID=A0AA47B5G2_9LACO|nr:hypothetical protein [Lactobacillus helsingborgensis]KJY65302.1 hypothetical protein JF73_06790 [Lactobacillus helsingborgensis]UZX30302.1 hypothetical protein LDX53_03655 [Lactobacillus helsingborgensis]